MKKYYFQPILIVVLILGIFTQCNAPAEQSEINLEEGFLNPPNEAKPRVWWHWMNGNISKEGVKKDFAWMNRIGIGGFQNFDAALSTPQIVENRLTYMTPEWKEVFEYTTNMADSLSLEMAIAGSPGWSESGGPWVPPAEGMKKFVWTETFVEGGTTFSGILTKPSTATGPFQNLVRTSESMLSDTHYEAPEYYKDAMVVAYKVPESFKTLKSLQPKVTSSGGSFNLDLLTDGDLESSSSLPNAPAGKKSWIQFEFNKSETIHSVSIVGGGEVGMFGRGGSQLTRALEVSNDGNNFEQVVILHNGGIAQTTVTFAPQTAKFFRVTFKSPEPAPMPDMEALSEMEGFFNFADLRNAPQGTDVSEIVLHTNPLINRFEEKAGFAVITNVEKLATPVADETNIIAPESIVDLTDQMQADGTLNWTAPEGTWNIIRFGYSLLGINNHPASPEATGLEVDKLNEVYVKNYFENYLDQYLDATGGKMGEEGLKYIITDSWEAGAANWTDDMEEEFNQRNNYDLKAWVPTLTGKIVESSEASEKFLWDYRNTLEEMVAQNHYDELTTILHNRGMGRYTESHESGRALIADGMEVKRSADIPMSATWTPGGLGAAPDGGPEARHEADIRESASVAHIYGQNINAAESFTAIGSTWAFSPERIKPTADFMLASGLNRFVIHTSVHQPVDDKFPGLGLGPFGQWFTRHETWAEQAKPWIDYLARSSYMLQQGQFIADIIYIYGQGSNLTSLFGNELPAIPQGYNYDFLNAGAVPSVLSVQDGKIKTESGMEYKILILDESTRYMTLPVLKKIQELVNNGAVVVGPKPINTPSLNDDQNEFQTITEQLWANENVYSNISIEDALNKLQIEPDFIVEEKSTAGKFDFVHRSLGNQEFYWVNTTATEKQSVKLSFRVSGFKPEIWNPVTGKISEVSYNIQENRTLVNLELAPEDAIFVVFREQTNTNSYEIPRFSESILANVSGEWNVKFQSERGAPESAVFNKLSAWNENETDGIKYFSGTAEYTKTISMSEEWITDGSEIWLDLGEVKNLAEVTLNGQSLGIVWKKPFRVKLNEAAKSGENQLSVKVTNLWVNRLIGDQQPNTKEVITYTTQAFYQADSPLLSSGLLGPVQIVEIN